MQQAEDQHLRVKAQSLIIAESLRNKGGAQDTNRFDVYSSEPDEGDHSSGASDSVILSKWPQGSTSQPVSSQHLAALPAARFTLSPH